jgi:putative ABC transport system permease protein
MKELFQIALSAIWSNKMRSLLTMLGIIIGISSVVTIVSIGDGTKASMNDQLSNLSGNNFQVYMNYRLDSEVYEKAMITRDDIAALQTKFEKETLEIAPDSSVSGEVVGNLEQAGATFRGSSSGTLKMSKATIVEGRDLLDEERMNKKNVVVVGERLAKDLFPGQSAIGQTLFLQLDDTSTGFQVVGVYTQEDQRSESYGGFIPIGTAQKILNQTQYGSINIYPAEGQSTDVLSTRIVKFLESRHDAEGQSFYMVFSPKAAMASVNDVLSKVTLLIAAIAGIALLVGGIGVMNIMLVSVTERIREIGIRKAIGAKRHHILIQFLIESVLLTLMGGIIGAVLGMGLAAIACSVMKVPRVISTDAILYASAFSIAIGLFFGIYPANQAAKLSPIEALRHE